MEPNNGADQDLNAYNYDYDAQRPKERNGEENDISFERNIDEEVISQELEATFKPEEVSIESIVDMLNCFICLKKVKEAVICPHCSKFSCENCLKVWIGEKKQECPMCRHPLTMNQIVKCRFLSDISKILESIKPQLLRNYNTNDSNENIDKCSEHQMKMIYYCVTCTKVVCSDCVMFTKTHENHKFERIKSVYEKKVDCLNREMIQMKKKISDYDNYLIQLFKQSETLKKTKEEKVKDLLSLYRTLNGNLDSELSTKMQKIEDEKRKVEDELEYFENMHEEILNQLKSLTPAKMILKSGEYMKLLAEMNSKKFISSIPKSIVSDFGSSISIKYAIGTFTLKPYSIYKNSNEIVYSDLLVADGITWRIKIYPNGTGAYKNIYLSLFVEMVKGWNQGGSYSYKITLVKIDRETENIEREYISEFENSICWGYNRFIKIEDLENQGFLDKEKDQIVLRYHIRPAHHLQKISDQTEYISLLENSLQKERSITKKLKHKLVKLSEKQGQLTGSEITDPLQKNNFKQKSEEYDSKAYKSMLEKGSIQFEDKHEAIKQLEEDRSSVEKSESEENMNNKNCIVDGE